ncbi:MAG TPA: glycosyltransferase family 2 protein [Stellaceae bacterium]|nr:glycosyltransferase family 2 protein [Stellaceae bacterium]
MTQEAATHLVLIPSYNTGAAVLATVAEARRAWTPVWVVVDGSTDGSGEALQRLAAGDPGLRVLIRARNGGKGAAVLEGLRAAEAEGFTHALTMDADGQHPAAMIAAFMALSRAHPEAMILGVPVFDQSAPRLRVAGRRVSNGLVHLETLWGGIEDSLFGFRVYPIAALRAVMESGRSMRRFDFDPEAAVRLSWRGVPIIARPVPVRYFRREEGGVSHFRYLRDNALLAWMHLRLLSGLVPRLPRLALRRLRSSRR